MGRQIAIGATINDEAHLLSFLRGTAEIRLIEIHAPTEQELWVDSFSPQLADHYCYYIWNTCFPWRPEYGKVGENAYSPERIGWSYVSNASDAPLIEFSRSDILNQRYGRLYWAKDFAAPDGLTYDVHEFSKWWNTFIRWVKKTAAGKKTDTWTTWFLPDAWQQLRK